jgi:DNA-binding NtrC family response regulator
MPIRVVVVEDGHRWPDHVRQALADLPVRCRHVAQHRDCLDALQMGRGHVVLAEMGPVPLAALEFLVRAHELDADASIVLLARSEQMRWAVAARECGAVKVIAQPVPPHEVTGLLRRLVAERLRLHERPAAPARQTES